MAHKGRPGPKIFHRDLFIGELPWLSQFKYHAWIFRNWGGTLGEAWDNDAVLMSEECQESVEDGTLIWEYLPPSGAPSNTLCRETYQLLFNETIWEITFQFLEDENVIAEQKFIHAVNPSGFVFKLFPWDTTNDPTKFTSSSFGATRTGTWAEIE